MRLRNIPGSEEEIAKSRFVIQNPEQYRGKWQSVFGNDDPIYIEVGMGKGRFLMDHALQSREINFLGIEMYSSVLVRAVQKAEQRFPEEDSEAVRVNFRLLRLDARELTSVFAPDEIGRIYLNFSDPWPKARHADRRLTSRLFLRRYAEILSHNGTLELKTDNTDLFDFSLEEFREEGWRILAETRDLHHDPILSAGNIMTEYEERFSQRGQSICKVIARP